MLLDYTDWIKGQPVAWNVKKAEAIKQLKDLLVAERIDELQRHMTLHVDLLTSADFKAGFSEALDQIDAANDIRIKQLKQGDGQHE